MKPLILICLFLLTLSLHSQSAPTLAVYFSPYGGCTEAIEHELKAAKKTILVESYSFTSLPIAEALIAARKRGVDVEVIMDKCNLTEKYSEGSLLVREGIPTFIDDHYKIFHDKVIIIDSSEVITGSFNFTKSAEESNAENLLIISNDADLAQRYKENWKTHLAESKRFVARY
jgi:phosphatidylserine/phosphatidylglycerophosphate/cardiolipin synthase-like enzyme